MACFGCIACEIGKRKIEFGRSVSRSFRCIPGSDSINSTRPQAIPGFRPGRSAGTRTCPLGPVWLIFFLHFRQQDNQNLPMSSAYLPDFSHGFPVCSANGDRSSPFLLGCSYVQKTRRHSRMLNHIGKNGVFCRDVLQSCGN
jgi:hypothetical protein